MLHLKQFFQYLHGTDFPYVVLRNFEGLPDYLTEGHEDIDLLVYDIHHFRELFPQAEIVHDLPRVMHRLKVGGEWIYIDVRHVGDNYYPVSFERELLSTREWNVKGFFTPNPLMFRLALAYHVVHHKNGNAYKKWIGDASVKELLEALKRSKVGYIAPKDPTVGRFNQYFKGATSIVSKEGDMVIKEQVEYSEYNLIDNEFRLLNTTISRHFPSVKKDGDKILIEDCGERLSMDNLPGNWEFQLVEILKDLKESNIEHRDIRPDNLMVKDGVIKLIDFGWARFVDDPTDNPPECLGYPYKPTWGWDDHFSVRKIIKEIDFKLEEKCEYAV